MAEEPEEQLVLEEPEVKEPLQEEEVDLLDVAEDVSVDQNGNKKVDAKAFIKERRGVKALKDELRAVKEQNEQFYRALTPWQPVLQKLQQNPDLLQRIASGEVDAPPVAPEDPTRAELAEFARSLDLYDSRGQPDIERAAIIDERNKRQMAALVEERIAPIQQNTANDKSLNLFQQMALLKGKAGRAVQPESLAEMWKAVPPHMTSDPNVAHLMRWAAMGRDLDEGKMADIPTPPPALMTETAGGRRSGPVTLNDQQQRVAKELGVSVKDFAAGIDFVAKNNGRLE